jgi:hypothetical protein
MGGAEPEPTGRWCWRFIADGWDGDDDTWHVRLAAGRSLLTLPLGEGVVYCYADLASGNGRPSGDWRDYFDGLGKPINDLLAQAAQAYATPITAHAMSPSMAQGVALAAEDALVLRNR